MWRGRRPEAGAGSERAPFLVEGVLQLKGAFGFVLSEDPAVGDVMVNGPTLKMAMGGDRVARRVTSARRRLVRDPRPSLRRTRRVLVHSRSTWW